jgi:hypothetical protein
MSNQALQPQCFSVLKNGISAKVNSQKRRYLSIYLSQSFLWIISNAAETSECRLAVCALSSAEVEFFGVSSRRSSHKHKSFMVQEVIYDRLVFANLGFHSP